MRNNIFRPLTLPFLFSFLAVSLAGMPSIAQDNEGYDEKLAKELGADEYGMRSYVFVTLKTGPANITDQDQIRELFRGHQANISRLADEGKLVVAGPFIEGGEKRGLFIFDVLTIEEAEELFNTDPAVKAGVFIPEYTKYYGSAALKQINNLHKKIQKTKIE